MLRIFLKKKKMIFASFFFSSGLTSSFLTVYANETGTSSSSPIIAAKIDYAQNYAAFLKDIRKEALEKHLASPAIVDQALSFAKEKPSQHNAIITHDRNQPEFHWSWDVYRDHVISSARLNQGKKEWQKEKKSLEKIAGQYGVDPRIILGIWGIESHFGEVEGKHNVFTALSTLAFDGRRSDFFRKELLTALEIAGKEDFKPSQMTSSYAGAMGQAQFMPSAYMRFATTGHRRGFFHSRYPDIWQKKKDVFNSIANYMKQSGWKAGMPWGEPVKISEFDGRKKIFSGTENYSSAPRYCLSEWEKLGVYPINGSHFSYPDLTGILLQPAGPKGESFMLYPNFKVIMRYNPSEFYALAAALLGDLSARAK